MVKTQTAIGESKWRLAQCVEASDVQVVRDGSGKKV